MITTERGTLFTQAKRRASGEIIVTGGDLPLTCRYDRDLKKWTVVAAVGSKEEAIEYATHLTVKRFLNP